MTGLQVPTVLSNDGRLSVFLPNRILSITNDHHAYKEILASRAAGDFERLVELADTTKKVSDYVSPSGKLSVRDGDVYYEGERLNNDAAAYLLEFMNAGHDVTLFVAFMERLMRNPSRTSQEAGFHFCFRRNWKQPMPILPDGRMLGYKRVREDYLDFFSGTVPYIPLHVKYPELVDNPMELMRRRGHRIRMKRWQCDDDRRNLCSTGYHVGNYEYVRGFYSGEGHIVAVAFDPADIVCVPQDARADKIRVCRLEVRHEISEAFVDMVFGIEPPSEVFTPTSYVDDSDDEDWNDADFVEEAEDEDDDF